MGTNATTTLTILGDLAPSQQDKLQKETPMDTNEEIETSQMSTAPKSPPLGESVNKVSEVAKGIPTIPEQPSNNVQLSLPNPQFQFSKGLQEPKMGNFNVPQHNFDSKFCNNKRPRQGKVRIIPECGPSWIHGGSARRSNTGIPICAICRREGHLYKHCPGKYYKPMPFHPPPSTCRPFMPFRPPPPVYERFNPYPRPNIGNSMEPYCKPSQKSNTPLLPLHLFRTGNRSFQRPPMQWLFPMLQKFKKKSKVRVISELVDHLRGQLLANGWVSLKYMKVVSKYVHSKISFLGGLCSNSTLESVECVLSLPLLKCGKTSNMPCDPFGVDLILLVSTTLGNENV